MSAPDFIALYVVRSAIVRPILGLPGSILTVWPRSDTHTLAVCRPTNGYPVIRHCYVPEGVLYGLVLNWEMSDIITPLSPASALRLIA